MSAFMSSFSLVPSRRLKTNSNTNSSSQAHSLTSPTHSHSASPSPRPSKPPSSTESASCSPTPSAPTPMLPTAASIVSVSTAEAPNCGDRRPLAVEALPVLLRTSIAQAGLPGVSAVHPCALPSLPLPLASGGAHRTHVSEPPQDTQPAAWQARGQEEFMRLQWEQLQRSLRKRKLDEHFVADEPSDSASATTTTQTSATGFGGGLLGRRPITDELFERRPTTDYWWSRLSGAGGGGTRRDIPRNPAPLALEHVMPFLADYDFTTTPLVVTTLQYVDTILLVPPLLSCVCVPCLVVRVRQSTVHRLPDMGAQKGPRPAATQRGPHIIKLRSSQPILYGSCVVCCVVLRVVSCAVTLSDFVCCAHRMRRWAEQRIRFGPIWRTCRCWWPTS
jgi:hypothetical protein